MKRCTSASSKIYHPNLNHVVVKDHKFDFVTEAVLNRFTTWQLDTFQWL